MYVRTSPFPTRSKILVPVDVLSSGSVLPSVLEFPLEFRSDPDGMLHRPYSCISHLQTPGSSPVVHRLGDVLSRLCVHCWLDPNYSDPSSWSDTALALMTLWECHEMVADQEEPLPGRRRVALEQLMLGLGRMVPPAALAPWHLSLSGSLDIEIDRVQSILALPEARSDVEEVLRWRRALFLEGERALLGIGAQSDHFLWLCADMDTQTPDNLAEFWSRRVSEARMPFSREYLQDLAQDTWERARTRASTCARPDVVAFVPHHTLDFQERQGDVLPFVKRRTPTHWMLVLPEDILTGALHHWDDVVSVALPEDRDVQEAMVELWDPESPVLSDPSSLLEAAQRLVHP